MIKALTINDISAYFDGTISDERRRDVVEALRTDVEAAALLQQYRQQREELHRLYDGVLSEPVPERMLSLLRQRRGH
jgi:anti-sigma factor RsiW